MNVIVDCASGHKRGCNAMCCRVPEHLVDVGLGVIDGHCSQLGEDNKCMIHNTRPKVCREYHCNGWKELQKIIGREPIAWFKEL
jgi:Fe-S-cluster containining protein